jgi:hypothetical protein
VRADHTTMRMHSENLEHQRRSVELFRGLEGVAEAESAGYAIGHMKIIERSPHRNEILGRQTTRRRPSFSRSRVRPPRVESERLRVAGGKKVGAHGGS